MLRIVLCCVFMLKLVKCLAVDDDDDDDDDDDGDDGDDNGNFDE